MKYRYLLILVSLVIMSPLQAKISRTLIEQKNDLLTERVALDLLDDDDGPCWNLNYKNNRFSLIDSDSENHIEPEPPFFSPYPEIADTFMCYNVLRSLGGGLVVYAISKTKRYKLILTNPEISSLSLPIQKGKSYKMTIQSVFPQKLKGQECMQPGSTGFTAISLPCGNFEIEPNEGILDLHIIKEFKELPDTDE